MTKPTKWPVHPAKIQISLGIRRIWSESSRCAHWITKDQRFLHTDSEYSLGAHGTMLVLSCGAQYDINFSTCHSCQQYKTHDEITKCKWNTSSYANTFVLCATRYQLDPLYLLLVSHGRLFVVNTKRCCQSLMTVVQCRKYFLMLDLSQVFQPTLLILQIFVQKLC